MDNKRFEKVKKTKATAENIPIEILYHKARKDFWVTSEGLSDPIYVEPVHKSGRYGLKGHFPTDWILLKLNPPKTLAKKMKNKKDFLIALSISRKDYDDLLKFRKDYEEKLEEIAKEKIKEITHLYVGVGGDTLQIYVTAPPDFPSELRNTKVYEKWIEYWERIFQEEFSIGKLREITEKTDFTSLLFNILYDDETWGKVSLDHPEVKKAVTKYLQKKREKELRKQKQIEEERKAKEEAIQKARKTGKPVRFRKVGFVEGEGEEGIIIVYETAFPDGKVKKEYFPTY